MKHESTIRKEVKLLRRIADDGEFKGKLLSRDDIFYARIMERALEWVLRDYVRPPHDRV